MTKVRFVGLDVHADTIAVAVAEPDGEVRSYGVPVAGEILTHDVHHARALQLLPGPGASLPPMIQRTSA